MSPVSNTSARRGPGRNRASETLLRRAAQRLNHLTTGSRYLSKTALFGPKTVSPRCHRFVSFGAEKCAMEKRVRVVAREFSVEDFYPHCQHASIHRIMPSGRASGNSVEVLVNFAEGAQTVSSSTTFLLLPPPLNLSQTYPLITPIMMMTHRPRIVISKLSLKMIQLARVPSAQITQHPVDMSMMVCSVPLFQLGSQTWHRSRTSPCCERKSRSSSQTRITQSLQCVRSHARACACT